MHDTPPRRDGAAPEPAERERPRHARHAPAPSPPASVFVYAWMLAAVSAVVFLAAGPVQGSLGIFLVAAGLALTCCPARVRVELPLWFAVGGLLVCGSLAFLPARWFPAPLWRAALSTTPAIHLPTTMTPVPWETGFWLAVLGISCLAGLFLLSHPIRARTVFRLAAAAVAVCGGYAALSIYARQTGWHYPFAGGASFGFFPNRNHTATLLVTGSIAALGVLTVGFREKRWTASALVAASLTVCVAGLFFYSGSRGGVIFLALGVIIWIAGLGRAHWNAPLFISVAALAVAGGVLFLVAGGEARSRLLGTSEPKAPADAAEATEQAPHVAADPLAASDHDTPLGFRLLIYRDTVAMIEDAPVSGMGLGTFAPVFAEYRRASVSASTPIHPESDWLMLAAETGVPTLVFALIVGGLLLARLRGAQHHPFWPLRWACVVAAAVAVLHGIVDVPSHRVALGWWILLLVALGAQSGQGREEKSSLVQRMLFVAGGLGALALGVQLIRAEWFGAPALPPFAAGKAREEILARFNRGDTFGALERAEAAVAENPLAAPIYYQFGTLLLHFQGTDAEADQAFAAQRVLSPIAPGVLLQQGDAWLPVDPKRAVALWLEGLERQIRIDRAQAAVAPETEGFFQRILTHAAPSADAQRELAQAAGRSPGFLLVWLNVAAPSIVREEFPSFLARTDLLAQLSPRQREKFLLLWYAKGERADLARFLDENPSWESAGWPVRLRISVEAKRFEEAVRTATDHFHISLALPPVSAPADRRPVPPEAEGDPLAVFDAAWRNGDPVGARRALNEAARLSTTPHIYPDVWRLEAAVDAQEASWPAAWQNLASYLRYSKLDESAP